MRYLVKISSAFLGLILSTQITFASQPSIRNLIHEYQYAMTVEWDQVDESFKNIQEQKLLKGIDQLLAQGVSPEQMLQEGVGLIPDARKREEVTEGIALYHEGRISSDQLQKFLSENYSAMEQQGPSWSPAKVIIGIVVGYAVFKILLLALYYADYDPNYSSGDSTPPPVP